MNKQEFQQKIKNMEPPKNFTFISAHDAYEKGFEEAKGTVLFNSYFLNEPEKPVIPQYVAEWLEVCKENLAISLAGSMNPNVLKTNNQSEKTIHWLAKNQETFVKAWLYGYEVEKDKLYTVFQVATEEYLYTNGVGKLSSVHVSYAFVEEHEEYHFTQQKLEELNYWDSPAFEVEEVKK